MNGAVTKGFEKDVGNKTSVYVHTSFSLSQSLLNLESYGFERIPQDEVGAVLLSRLNSVKMCANCDLWVENVHLFEMTFFVYYFNSIFKQMF